jgi:1,4-alpha-glucan branching enzyme
LKPYPTGKAEGIVSVLQTGQTPYQWQVTDFKKPDRNQLMVYEMHIRDFTSEHSFNAAKDKLPYLKQLGINAIELMPVNEFEGNSSWGYNPSFYFAVDKYYGTKNDMRAFVDECHRQGIAVIIDLVLNHSFGQSPFYLLYREADGTPSADNPWYNQKSNIPNAALQWGYDFNHQSTYTRALVDSVAGFWMKEYKVDGFRYDFTKGFSNTSQDTWANKYDAERIANLKRMSLEKEFGCLCYYRTSDGGYYGREGIGRGRHHALEKHESCVL